MGLHWNEIKSRALLFSKTWDDACNENSLAKPFWIDFFEIIGITDKRVGNHGVLDTRVQFAGSSLADLYDPLTMPPALLKVHQKLDTADDAAYQPSGGKKSYASNAERVAFLFELYQRITSLPSVAATKKTRKTKVTEST
jgi:hypothetical protein